MYVIVRCKLDEKVSTEVEFSPEDSPSVRVEGTLENEYTVSVKAPGEWPRGDTEHAAQLPSETLLSIRSPTPHSATQHGSVDVLKAVHPSSYSVASLGGCFKEQRILLVALGYRCDLVIFHVHGCHISSLVNRIFVVGVFLMFFSPPQNLFRWYRLPPQEEHVVQPATEQVS